MITNRTMSRSGISASCTALRNPHQHRLDSQTIQGLDLELDTVDRQADADLRNCIKTLQQPAGQGIRLARLQWRTAGRADQFVSIVER